MSMPDSALAFHQPLTPSHIADVRLAASTMTGAKRRAFEAEMTLKYGEGNPLQAAITFGWSRRTVALGLAERRTGIMCLGAQAAFSGRKRWEDTQPQVAEALCHLAEAPAPHDPTFRTSLASTRLTVQAALAALRAQGYREAQLPSPRTMAAVRHRLGFRLRHVVKAKPQKTRTETDAIFDTMDTKTRKRRPRTPSKACASIGKRRSPSARARVVASRGASIRPATTIWACRRNTFRVGSGLQITGSCA